MSMIERRAYTRRTFKCDWCGKQTNLVRLDEEPLDSPHQLPLPDGWQPVPVIRFFDKGDLHACSQEHAELVAVREVRGFAHAL